ncbi:MAG: MBL fold metallo-hydrolase [Deltaproteobacteria bacterium]|nr:MBL fold metallo-hydrolase [Deltaproteobacteria bacterium]
MLHITRLDAATTIVEIGSVRLLTDPVFDPAGTESHFGFGTHSRKLTNPPIPPSEIGPIDAVLLSHDHHADNLDEAGRSLLPGAGVVLTTHSGAGRLGGNAKGLQAGQQVFVTGFDGFRVRVTVAPARHGPPFSRPFVGSVIGFFLEWDGQRDGGLWISGDTVWYGTLASFFVRRRVGAAILHLGRAAFASTGPIRYTMNTRDAVQATHATGAARIVPVHFDGFTHFSEGRKDVERAFAAAGFSNRLLWLPLAQRTPVEC